MITINEMELADEIASALMDERYRGDPWMQEDPEDHDTLIVKDECRLEYDAFYDEALTLIKSCEHI